MYMCDFFLPLGGGDEVGASCYLLAIGQTRVMIDVGMRFHTERAFPDFSRLYPVAGGMNELDALLLTHAHLDHCGALTRIQYEAPRLPKFATAATLDLAGTMLRDALRIAQHQRGEDWHIVDSTQTLLEQTLATFDPLEFGQRVPLGDTKGFVTPLRAGHILGAVSYLIEVGERRILHTGDFSLHHQHTIVGADFLEQVGEVDTLIIESTYAYQPEYRAETVEEQQFELLEMLGSALAQGGRVLIPAFALGRAQEIACLIGDWFEQGLIEPFPVRLDGLVKAVCDNYNVHRASLQGRIQARPGHAIYNQWIQPMHADFYPSARNVPSLGPMCIISSSGMLMDQTRSAAYAEAMLPNPNDAIIFSGYLDDESPGYRLAALAKPRTEFQINGRIIEVRAQVRRYHLSAHAPAPHLRQVIQALHPKNVVLIHGDYSYSGVTDFIQFRLEQERTGVHFYQSANGVPIYL